MGGEYGDEREFNCKNVKDGLETNFTKDFAEKLGLYIGTELTVAGGGTNGMENSPQRCKGP